MSGCAPTVDRRGSLVARRRGAEVPRCRARGPRAVPGRPGDGRVRGLGGRRGGRGAAGSATSAATRRCSCTRSASPRRRAGVGSDAPCRRRSASTRSGYWCPPCDRQPLQRPHRPAGWARLGRRRLGVEGPRRGLRRRALHRRVARAGSGRGRRGRGKWDAARSRARADRGRPGGDVAPPRLGRAAGFPRRRLVRRRGDGAGAPPRRSPSAAARRSAPRAPTGRCPAGVHDPPRPSAIAA